jgi:hypothetical protein
MGGGQDICVVSSRRQSPDSSAHAPAHTSSAYQLPCPALCLPALLPCCPAARRKLSKDVRGYVQKCVDKGKEVNLTSAINKDTITRGLRWVGA